MRLRYLFYIGVLSKILTHTLTVIKIKRFVHMVLRHERACVTIKTKCTLQRLAVSEYMQPACMYILYCLILLHYTCDLQPLRNTDWSDLCTHAQESVRSCEKYKCDFIYTFVHARAVHWRPRERERERGDARGYR